MVFRNLFGGFDGYLSKLRYFNKSLEYDEIQDIVREGPSSVITADTGELPPYFVAKAASIAGNKTEELE